MELVSIVREEIWNGTLFGLGVATSLPCREPLAPRLEVAIHRVSPSDLVHDIPSVSRLISILGFA
ncbi:hypothetical protein BO99DRAFT_20304 [Aspergillus violaceofuscus CBS 115571]|uniref:Uncharacterized protein n=1 Tax=Aspergillus violaceofuscus (strain CBS 115571) TaxID=1450538 RepID=A0A2V5I1G3_ASPV1|nr:hypothetical protein BO99DRAFT_20304 [Aspergillus violaceofuscus CBS 115571]